MPILVRRSAMSAWSNGSPSISTVPCVGLSNVAATCNSVVFPAPFGPMMTQLSSLLAIQSMSRSSIDLSYRTPTPRRRSTSAAIRFPSRAPSPSTNLRHDGGPGRHRSVVGSPDCKQGCLRPVGHAELGQHGADVRLHGLFRHAQSSGDLPIGLTVRQQG